VAEPIQAQAKMYSIDHKDKAFIDRFLCVCKLAGLGVKTKLPKHRLKAHLKERYKMHDRDFPKNGIAHKVAEVFSWTSGSMTIETYASCLDKILNEQPPVTLINLAFRIYDVNNDNKVDELDLYSIMYFFENAVKPEKATEVRNFEQQMFKQIIQVEANTDRIYYDNLFIKALSSDICVIQNAIESKK
jgi:Ca2+-binding EF-hand superfamily protein